jgi:glycerophosphoryl diester phosphodiesterase
MIILSHRGLWNHKEEKNTLKAMELSFSLGFGTETDIRDYKGKLVISHDIADENSILLDQMLEIYCKYDKNLYLALNIKADGLQEKLEAALKNYQIENYFVFDMSVPEGIKYLKNNFNVFTRESEYEESPSFYEQAKGVWLDCFNQDWINEAAIVKHLNHNKLACVVSPDLHQRDYLDVWNGYKKLAKYDKFFLCTDHPKQAKDFFNF